MNYIKKKKPPVGTETPEKLSQKKRSNLARSAPLLLSTLSHQARKYLAKCSMCALTVRKETGVQKSQPFYRTGILKL